MPHLRDCRSIVAVVAARLKLQYLTPHCAAAAESAAGGGGKWQIHLLVNTTFHLHFHISRLRDGRRYAAINGKPPGRRTEVY